MLAFSPQVDAFFERGDEVDDVYAMLQSVPDRSYVDALGSQGFAAADVCELWSLGVTQAEIGQLRELGYSAVEMMDFKKLGASMDHAEELLKLGFMRGPALARLGITAGHSSEQIAKLDALKFTPQQIADMGLFGTSPETAAAGLEAGHTHATTVAFAKEYLRLGIPLNPSTISTVSARSSLDELGAGNLNTVYEGMYSWSGAVAEPTVFKPIAAPVVAGTASLDSSVLGQHIGVLEHDPKFAERNLATDAAQRWGHTLAQSLDIDMPSVYVATSLGLSRGSQTVGVVMKYSPGVPARELSAAQLRSPEFRRQAMWLQVWDQILGQGDRHSGNYLYTVDGDGKARIAAIDNDLCCGSNQHPEALRYERGKNDHARGVGLPPVIDTEMAALLKAMTADDLKAVFKNILPEAADAAVARLGVLKAHALELQQAGQVVTSSQWSGSVATEALADPTRSYAGRELARALTLAAE